jgi:hypothetical protein
MDLYSSTLPFHRCIDSSPLPGRDSTQRRMHNQDKQGRQRFLWDMASDQLRQGAGVTRRL